MGSLFQEIKRRNVFRVAFVYIVAGWLTMQVADVMFPALSLPAWTVSDVAAMVLIGFPFALIFAWAFELTPEGIKRDKDVDPSTSIAPETGRRLNRTAVIILAVAVGFLLFDRFVWAPRTTHSQAVVETSASKLPAAAMRPSIAVLPFVNMSADADNEYFSDGLSEELLNVLARIPELHVAGRTSSFAFKGQNADLRSIGQQLNVDNILEGSVRRSNTRLRITAQLINTENGYHLWSETYDRELDDIFAVQDEISAAVAEALEVTLLGGGSAQVRNPVNVEAYELYLQARYLIDHPNEENLHTAVAKLDRAIEIAPDYAAAYALMAGLVSMQTSGFVGPGSDFDRGFRQVRAYAEKAIALDDQSSEAHQALGLAAQQADWNFPAATRAYERALELEPGNVDAMSYLADMYMLRGDFETAIELQNRALALDPLSTGLARDRADGWMFEGEYDRAIGAYKELLLRSSTLARINGRIALAYLFKGELAQAKKYNAAEPVEWAREFIEILIQTRSEPEAWRKAAEAFAEKWGEPNAYQIAQIYALGGDADKAFEWLATAVRVHDPGTIWSKVENALQGLQDDPRMHTHLVAAGIER
jgi:TolB-like protein/Tfp pilus assembly protein PilF